MARRRRQWLWWTFGILGGLLILGMVLAVVSARSYRGPHSLEAVQVVMPGVPLFPFAELTANNTSQQTAMAIPLWLLRRQGAAHAETAFLQVPADPDFIEEWHRRALAKRGWTLSVREPAGEHRRLLFVKGDAAVQVLIGRQQDLTTAYQLVYLAGLPPRKLTDLR
jgi:hypothetical protein